MNNNFQQTIIDPPCVGEAVNDGVNIVISFTPIGCREPIIVALTEEESVISSLGVPRIIQPGFGLATPLPLTGVQVQSLSNSQSGDTIQRDTSAVDGFLLAALFFAFLLIFFTIQRFIPIRRS